MTLVTEPPGALTICTLPDTLLSGLSAWLRSTPVLLSPAATVVFVPLSCRPAK